MEAPGDQCDEVVWKRFGVRVPHASNEPQTRSGPSRVVWRERIGSGKSCSQQLSSSAMSQPLHPHEESTVRAFIVRERRERFLELLPNPKRRRTITDALAHANPAWFDSRFITSIKSSQSSAKGILNTLQAKGAGPKCWLISETSGIDGTEMELREALSQVVGHGMGTIISCIPGQLAFVETEDGRFILEKR